jgi:hypothetical protein
MHAGWLAPGLKRQGVRLISLDLGPKSRMRGPVPLLSYIYIYRYVAWCLIKHRENSTISLYDASLPYRFSCSCEARWMRRPFRSCQVPRVYPLLDPDARTNANENGSISKIHSFIHLWLYSPLLDPGLFFSFVIFFTQTVGLLGQVASKNRRVF